MDNPASILHVEEALGDDPSPCQMEGSFPENYGKIQMSLMVNKLYKKMRGKIQFDLEANSRLGSA